MEKLVIENRQLKGSNLRVKRYFVTRLNIIANPSFDVQKGMVHKDGELTVTGEMTKSPEDPKLFQIRLNIQVQAVAESNLPYSIVIEVVGLLQSGFTGTPEDIERVMFVNGASILYGTAREIVRSVTAAGPYSQILLPSVGFIPPAKVQSMKIEAQTK